MCDIGAFDLAIRTNTNFQIQQHEPRGARFKRLLQPNQPSMETTMYILPRKTRALLVVVQT